MRRRGCCVTCMAASLACVRLQVNHQCVAKLEKAESECQGLLEKYGIVENDKKSLMQVRGQLMVKGWEGKGRCYEDD